MVTRATNGATVVASVVAVVLVALSTSSWAQRDVPLAQTSLEITPSSAVDADSTVEIASMRWSVGFVAPLRIDRRTLVVIAPRYQVWRFTSDDVDDRTIHAVGLSTTLRRRLSARWALNTTAGIALASDFREVDADHIRLTGAVTGERTVSPTLRLGLGVAANYNFGELLPLPLLTANWFPTQRLHMVAALPAVAGITVRWTERFRSELRGGLVGNRFSIQGSPSSLVDNISVSSGQIEVRGGWRLFGSVWGFASVGYTAFRRLELFDRSDTQLADLTPQRSLVGSVSIELRIPVPRPPR